MKELARTLAAVAALLCGTGAARADSPAARVVILANRDDPGSIEVARHYAEARGVPAANLFAYSLSREETISWPEFVSTLWNPLLRDLARAGWIDALFSSVRDPLGRFRYVAVGHRIAALVVCRGVPLRIRDEPAFDSERRPYTDRPEFRTNAGAVDSELSLLAGGNYPVTACVDNPLFQKDSPNPALLAAVVKVARLDGPTVADARALVDRAIEAERTGLIGRACFDLGAEYPIGDLWLESAALEAGRLGFDETIDRTRWPLAETARCDQTALYFGWHFSEVNGPFLPAGFRFAPGAIAFHIHSFSARTLRSDHEAWCGPLVARGATATLGNVFEPYLEFTHRPDLLLDALARGWDLADAAYYALPVLSWQCVLIGDPLYRPFAVSLDEQWSRRASLSPERAGYVALRRMVLLENGGRGAEALQAGGAVLAAAPSPALALAVAARLQSADRAAAALAALESAGFPDRLRPDQWALAREAARLFEAFGRPAEAVGVYRRLFAQADLPGSVRGPWLVDARRCALAAGQGAQAAAWKGEIDALVAGILRDKAK